MSERQRGYVYVWTGLGGGKTTSALGTALRVVGHGDTAVIVQFMKGRGEELGELKAKKLLGDSYQIHQFGRPTFVDLECPAAEDCAYAAEGLAFAQKIMLEKKPTLLVLDEVLLAVTIGLMPLDDLLQLIDLVPVGVNLYLTGHFCPFEVFKRADYVTEVHCVKAPKEILTRKGIEY